MVDMMRVETNRHEAFIVDRGGVRSQTAGLKAGRYKRIDPIRSGGSSVLVAGRALARPTHYCVGAFIVLRGSFSGQFAEYHAKTAATAACWIRSSRCTRSTKSMLE
jgi:hypothetical protein